MRTAIRSSSWPKARSWPRARWPSFGRILKWWRRTLSVELSQPGLVLSTRALAAGYDGRAIVSDISIEATPGKVISIVGPNGSGKSTLLKSLVGVVRVLDGSVRVGDSVITNMPP